VHHAAEHALRNTFRRRIDRRDPAKVDRDLLVILDDFEFWMIHANSLSAQPRLAENHHALTGGDHFLHVMKIEPPAHQRLAQGVWVRLLQRGFENFLPAAETPHRRLDHLPTKTNRNIALLAWKLGKLSSIFMAPWKMRKQTFHRLDAQPPQRQKLWARDPI